MQIFIAIMLALFMALFVMMSFVGKDEDNLMLEHQDKTRARTD